MADFISRSASSRVVPVATQPGISGEYAEYPVPVFSITIRNFMASIYLNAATSAESASGIERLPSRCGVQCSAILSRQPAPHRLVYKPGPRVLGVVDATGCELTRRELAGGVEEHCVPELRRNGHLLLGGGLIERVDEDLEES